MILAMLLFPACVACGLMVVGTDGHSLCDSERIQMGMTKDEVEAILGPGLSVSHILYAPTALQLDVRDGRIAIGFDNNGHVACVQALPSTKWERFCCRLRSAIGF